MIVRGAVIKCGDLTAEPTAGVLLKLQAMSPLAEMATQ